MATGVVRRIVSDKGFGFIRDEVSQLEHFFHRSSMIGTPFEHLKEGQRVSFVPEESDKGPRAGQVEAL